MNAMGLYANLILWVMLIAAFERRGSIWAHKVMVVLRQDYRCRCHICHPEVAL